ncbi:MAG: hypothetical protein NVSMB64_15030 [Candidatus Velthaea sp.]
MNTLTPEQRERIVALIRAGKTLRRIENETGHRRETIAAYGRRAGLLDGAVTSLDEHRAPESMYEPHREFIERSIEDGASLRDIHDSLGRAFGLRGSYSALKRYVRLRETRRTGKQASLAA